MIFRKVTTLLTLSILLIGSAGAKPKKEKISAIFQNARIVYVQSVDGDALDPRLYPEDRSAIFDVQQRLRDWNRYTITLRREDADLVFMVRKGRAAVARTRTGISVGQPIPGGSYPGRSPGQSPGQYPGQYPGQGTPQPGSGTQMGTSADIGPAEDMLRIFTTNQDGKLIGPIWARELDGGLDAPSVQLVRDLEAAVEDAYPRPAPSPKPAGQSQPQTPTQPPAQPQPQPQAPPQPQPQR